MGPTVTRVATIRHLVAIATCFVIATAFLGSTREPEIDLTSTFPLELGNRWEYDAQLSGAALGTQTRTATYVNAVCRIQQADSTTRLVLYTTCTGQDATSLEFAQSEILVPVSGEVIQTAIQGRDGAVRQHDPPERLIRTPLALGQVWQWQGKIGDDERRTRYVVASRGRVFSPAGTYEAVRVLAAYGDASMQSGVVERWYSPGVGLIRESGRVPVGTAEGKPVFVEMSRSLRSFQRVDVAILDCCGKIRSPATP